MTLEEHLKKMTDRPNGIIGGPYEQCSTQQEQEIKALREELNKHQCGAAGVASQGLGFKLGLQDRIKRQSRAAKQEAQKIPALSELEALLDKHPDIARILDLLEDL